MTRFRDEEDGIPWEMWETIVSRALIGKRGQEVLAGMEAALLALPEKKLIRSHLVLDGGVCAIGAYAASKRAEKLQISIEAVITEMDDRSFCTCTHMHSVHRDGRCTGEAWGHGHRPCTCEGFVAEIDSSWATVEEGTQAGISQSLSWHLAWLNDEQFANDTPEERYAAVLTYVRRAQGKETAAA